MFKSYKILYKLFSKLGHKIRFNLYKLLYYKIEYLANKTRLKALKITNTCLLSCCMQIKLDDNLKIQRS